MASKNDDFIDFVLDQLHRLSGIRQRRMFGAYGLYRGETFFAIVDDGAVYFRTNENTRRDYVDRGQKPFEPNPGQVLKNYYEVPVDILEDDTQLCEWAEKAIAAQIKNEAAKKNKRRSK